MANVINRTESLIQLDMITSFPEYKAGILIWKVVPPILILLGTVGNCLSIFVLTRKAIRSSTTALYLTVLAFSDLLVLYTGLLRQWLIYLFDTDFRKLGSFGCKLNIWLVYSSLDFSAWILIAVTLERVVSAWLPHNAKTICTKKNAIAFLIAIGVFIIGLNAHVIYGMVFKYNQNHSGVSELAECSPIDDNYKDFFAKTWPWIDLCAFCVIPFTVIVIGNVLILLKVIKSQNKTKSRIVPSTQNGTLQTTSHSHASKQSSMTAMLFTLNVVFLVSTSPISIYNIGYTYWEKGSSKHVYAQLELWWAVVNMFMYINNSLNFLLYCLSGSRFRREVIRIFSFRKNNVHNRNVRMADLNYTRTKFDTPSPSPTPGYSGSHLTVPGNRQVKTAFSTNPSTACTAMTDSQKAGISVFCDRIEVDRNELKHHESSLHSNDDLTIASEITTLSKPLVSHDINLATANSLV